MEEKAIVTELAADQSDDAIPTSASDFVSADKDRPVADNKKSPMFSTPQESSPAPAVPPGEGVAKSKRGRPKLSDEEKAKRAAIKANKPPPSFSDITHPAPPKPSEVAAATPRDYNKEAAEIFIPVSMFLGRALGDHWGLKIDQEKKTVDLSDEQKQYLYSMARWLEFEQFPPMNPRWGFAIATLAYAAPKIKTDPTPERLKIGYLKVSGWFKRLFKKKEKDE